MSMSRAYDPHTTISSEEAIHIGIGTSCIAICLSCSNLQPHNCSPLRKGLNHEHLVVARYYSSVTSVKGYVEFDRRTYLA